MKALSFEGNAREYFKIWIVNILLVIITVGIYYPWAKVRNHRYIYANSILDGRNFEYHATGKQLFLGYLIAVILLIIYTVISQISPIGGVILAIIGFFAFPWVVWRSLKFNMRMTSFSNVRFSFNGQLGGAYITYMLLPMFFIFAVYVLPVLVIVFFSLSVQSQSLNIPLTVLISGVIIIAAIILSLYAFALMKKRQTEYAINGYAYGQGGFETHIETKRFLKILLNTLGLGFLISIGFLLIVSIVGILGGLAGAASFSNPEDISNFSPMAIIFIALIYIGAICANLFLYAYMLANQREYIYENSSLDGKISFISTLDTGSLATVLITNLLAILFSLGFATPWAQVRYTRLLLENTKVDTEAGFDEYITQQQEEQSALGEQIGDVFDANIDIGI